VRNTQDIDIVLRRADLERAKEAFAAAGFLYRQSFGVDMFVDGPAANARESVHVIFAREKIRPSYVTATPDVAESKSTSTARVLSLEALVTMKLTSLRDKDRTHLRDLIDVGLIDPSWTSRLPAELAARLQRLLDTPEG
jgi:hypothetical protein